MEMLRTALTGNKQKTFTKLLPVEGHLNNELKAFKTLQRLLSTLTYLVHFDPARRLYIDVDASKVYGFGSLFHHVKGDQDPITTDGKCAQFKRQDVKPITLLSKLLTQAKQSGTGR